MTKPKILVVGSSNTDMIIKLARIPRPGETLLGGEFAIAAGGKGANQAVAAARAGGAVTLVARVGRDMFGDETIPRLGREGIAVGNISRDTSAPSGVALIFVARSGENSIAVASGANGRLSAADVRRARREFTGAAALVMQLETPLPALNEAAISMPLLWARGASSSTTPSASRRRSTVSTTRSKRPASILARSRISSISAIRALPELRMAST